VSYYPNRAVGDHLFETGLQIRIRIIFGS
jgi:hypothetical protein